MTKLSTITAYLPWESNLVNSAMNSEYIRNILGKQYPVVLIMKPSELASFFAALPEGTQREILEGFAYMSM
jgi:hypothetical protein